MEKDADLHVIKIAVCDDELIIRKELSYVIQNILEREKIPYKLEEFAAGQDLLRQIEGVELVFLDIEMPQLDGIQVGERIKRKNPGCQIIIASGREDRFKETYQIKALRFISKPFDEEEVWDAIQAYQQECRVGMEEIEVFQNRVSCRIRQRDIQYISVYKNGVEIVANGELYRKDISLNKIEEILETDCFFKVYKGYIVNLFHITDYTEKEVLIGKIKIPLSRRQRKEFERAYMEFDFKYR